MFLEQFTIRSIQMKIFDEDNKQSNKNQQVSCEEMDRQLVEPLGGWLSRYGEEHEVYKKRNEKKVWCLWKAWVMVHDRGALARREVPVHARSFVRGPWRHTMTTRSVGTAAFYKSNVCSTLYTYI